MSEPREETRMGAATAGRRKYHGQPCKGCGATLRYTSTGQCINCARERSEARHITIKNLLRDADEGS